MIVVECAERTDPDPGADRHAIPHPAVRKRRFGWETAGWVLFVVLLVVGCPIAIYRAVHDTGGTDFPEFHAAGRYVLEHGTRQPNSFLFRYPPSLDVPWAALSWLPLGVAAAVWYLLGCGTWVGLLQTIRRYLLVDAEEPIPRHAVLTTGLLVMPLVLDHLCLGAFHILMIWLMIAGLGRVSRGRVWSGGALLGLAIWVKMLPLAGAGYLVWKRRWLPAAIAVLTAVAVDIVLSVAVFGPSVAWETHRQWWRNEVYGVSDRLMDHPEFVDEDRLSNQSPAAITRRLLTTMGTAPWLKDSRVSLADLSASQLQAVYVGLLAALGLGIAAVCRRAGRATTPSQWSTEIALVLLATLWFSPVAWAYHFIAVAPAMAVVFHRTPTRRRFTWGLVLVWLLALALLGSNRARSAGEMLWMSFLLGGLLVWTATMIGRRQEAHEFIISPARLSGVA